MSTASERSAQGVAQATGATGVIPTTRGGKMAQPEYLALREIAPRGQDPASNEEIPAFERSTKMETGHERQGEKGQKRAAESTAPQDTSDRRGPSHRVKSGG
jgi:hypothetical protein